MPLISTNNLSEFVTDSILSILLIVATILCVVVAFVLIKKYENKGKGHDFKKVLTTILLCGFAIRILLSFLVIGHRRELDEVIYKTLNNPKGLLYPITYYLIGFFNLPSALSGTFIENSVLSNVMIKLPFIFADIASAYIIYKFASKYANEYIGLIACGFVCFCPLFVFASSMWASIITLIVPFMLATVYCVITKKHMLAIIFYGCAMLCAKEAVVFLPAFAIYYGYVFIKSLIQYKSNPEKFKITSNPLFIPFYAIGTFLAGYILSLPYLISFDGAGIIDYFYRYFVSPFVDVVYYSQNAPTIFTFFGCYENFKATELPSGYNVILFISLFVVVLAIISFVSIKFSNNRAVSVLNVAYIGLTAFTYFVGFSAVSAIAVIMLLFASFIVLKDKRIFISLAVQTVIMVFVMSMVFTRAGYYNTLPLINFTHSDYTSVYHRMTILCGDYKWVMYIASALQVINHAFLTFVLFNHVFKKTKTEQLPNKAVEKHVSKN